VSRAAQRGELGAFAAAVALDGGAQEKGQRLGGVVEAHRA
jgi:hypothetical protein